jgi:hypothetical protein
MGEAAAVVQRSFRRASFGPRDVLRRFGSPGRLCFDGAVAEIRSVALSYFRQHKRKFFGLEAVGGKILFSDDSGTFDLELRTFSTRRQ